MQILVTLCQTPRLVLCVVVGWWWFCPCSTDPPVGRGKVPPPRSVNPSVMHENRSPPSTQKPRPQG